RPSPTTPRSLSARARREDTPPATSSGRTPARARRAAAGAAWRRRTAGSAPRRADRRRAPASRRHARASRPPPARGARAPPRRPRRAEGVAVAERAGVSAAAFSRGYPLEAERFVEVYRAAADGELTALGGAARRERSVTESLASVVAAYARRALHNPRLAWALV